MASDSGDGYRRDGKESRTPSRRDSDSKSHERRQSRSRSTARHVASTLVDRSRRKLGLLRHRRSPSRDRRFPTRSDSRSAASHAVRRSRSRERPAAQRSTERGRLEEEEHRLRKQLDELMARKGEETRGRERQYSPTFGHDKSHNQSVELPSLFDRLHSSDDDRQLPRRHLLPAPHLLSAGVKGRPLLEPPACPRLLDSERPNIDIDRGKRFTQSADLPTTSLLPGLPFVQEYSHKPAKMQTDQLRFDVFDHANSPKETECRGPVFREDLGQHRYRPYPVPEDRQRVPPDSAERDHNWQPRNRPAEQRDSSSKTSSFAPSEEDEPCSTVVSEHSAPSFSTAVHSPAVYKSAATSTDSTASSAKPEAAVAGKGLLPLSSAPSTFSGDVAAADTQAPNTSRPKEMEMTPPPRPPLPMPPNFPAFVQQIQQNLMFHRGPGRVPFGPITAGNMPVPPRLRGMFRPPLFGPFPPAPVNPLHDSNAVERAPAPSSSEAASTNKKPLLGDFPVPVQASEVDSSQQGMPRQHSEERQVEQASEENSSGARRLMAPPRLMEADQAANSTDEVADEAPDEPAQQNTATSEIPQLLDFSLYRRVDKTPRGPPRPAQLGRPAMMPPTQRPQRGRMPLPPRGVPPFRLPARGPVPRAAMRPDMDMRRGGGAQRFPRRGVPRGRYPHPE